jgi:hypothetical protein
MVVRPDRLPNPQFLSTPFRSELIPCALLARRQVETDNVVFGIVAVIRRRARITADQMNSEAWLRCRIPWSRSLANSQSRCSDRE